MRAFGAAVLVWLAAAPAGAQPQPALRDLAQARVADLSAAVVMDEQDAAELKRMGKDYASFYRFGRANVQFLEPGRMRMESQAGFLRVLYVINQRRRLVAVPAIGVRHVKDLSDSPGSRQGLLEVGLVTPSLLALIQARPLGAAVVEGVPAWRYAVAYLGDDPGKRQEIAVDPATRTLVERRIYRADGSLKARLVYREPVQVAEGVWVPRRIELHSPWGKRAAVTRYERTRVNEGIGAEAFAF